MYEQKDGVFLAFGFTAFVVNVAIEFEKRRVGQSVEVDIEMDAISMLGLVGVILPRNSIVLIRDVGLDGLGIAVAGV